METLGMLFALAIGALLIWLLFRHYRDDPNFFSKENLVKSLGSMGLLALILIAFIAVCIVLLRQ